MGGNFDICDTYELDCQNLTRQYLKTVQHLQVYDEKQWPSIKIFSVKYLKSQYPSRFHPVKILRYTVRNSSITVNMATIYSEHYYFVHVVDHTTFIQITIFMK